MTRSDAVELLEMASREAVADAGRLNLEKGPRGIGARITRNEDARFLAGHGEYLADLNIPRTMEVAFLRSPVAHGRIAAVHIPHEIRARVFLLGDLGEVRPVRAVLNEPTFRVSDFPALASEVVRFVGEPIAMCIAANRAEAEDLVQQIFLAVWQALPSFRADASLKTFIARVAQNRSISFVTRQVRLPPVAEISDRLEDDLPNPEESAIEASERKMLLDATRRLPLPQRQVIILILEGFSYPEIAEMLEIAPNALALRLSRAKAALKSMLEEAQ